MGNVKIGEFTYVNDNSDFFDSIKLYKSLNIPNDDLKLSYSKILKELETQPCNNDNNFDENSCENNTENNVDHSMYYIADDKDKKLDNFIFLS